MLRCRGIRFVTPESPDIKPGPETVVPLSFDGPAKRSRMAQWWRSDIHQVDVGKRAKQNGTDQRRSSWRASDLFPRWARTSPCRHIPHHDRAKRLWAGYLVIP